MVGSGPDVKEDQRPEVHDGEPIGIDRPLHAFRDEVVHDAEESSGEEEAHRVVAVPPLRHRILYARINDVALRTNQAYRYRRVVDEVQHGDGDDEREEKPVGDVDVRLLAPRQRAEEHKEIDHPDDGEPEVRVPFVLGVLLALSYAEQITCAGYDDEELISPDHEPGRPATRQTRVARTLYDVERGRDQHVAPERKDHGRGVQRSQPTEAGPG